MSVKQMAMVWEHDFGHAEQSIMLALADHAHDDGTEIRPSVARLAWKTGYEERQVQRILKHLRDDIKILVMTKEGGGRGNPNVYRFDWTKGVKKSPFTPKKRVTSDNGKGDISELKGDIARTPEPSTEPSSIEPSAPQGSASPEPTKDRITLLVDRCREMDFEPTPKQKQTWANELNAKARADLEDRELMRLVNLIAKAGADGYFWSFSRAERETGKQRGKTSIGPAPPGEYDPEAERAKRVADRQRQMEEVFGRTA